MLRVGTYVFKRADSHQEFEQIHRLNHRVFVDEIPQHEASAAGFLVDKFHHKNAYMIVKRDDRVLGMVSAHDEPPFSIAERLPDPAILTKPGIRPLEVRLLAIEPDERNSNIFLGLLYSTYDYAQKSGFTHLFISGLVDRQPMYERLGFKVLGPAVVSGQATFVPMVLPVEELPRPMQVLKKMWETHVDRMKPKIADVDSLKKTVCLLPGPVTTSRAVREAFHQPPIYHRGPEFIERFGNVRRHLGQLVGGREVAILNGSGTLGNECIAATLAAQQRTQPERRHRGVLLINGEFGERLAKQAIRFGLEPRTLAWDWGQRWDLDEVDAALAAEPEGTWVWGVHQESSTGVLNDLPGLVRLAKRRGARVCLDCISSLGAVPLDLSEVFLATGATGKALGSFAGASVIFADREALIQIDRRLVPSYFDIVGALNSEGPCYTFPSPTLAALEAALQEYATPGRAQATYARYHELGVRIRQELRRLGITPLAREEHACPVVTTFSPPNDEPSEAFVSRCRSWGYDIGGESAYLSCRRLVQIATMGAMRWDHVAAIFDHLENYLAKRSYLAGV